MHVYVRFVFPILTSTIEFTPPSTPPPHAGAIMIWTLLFGLSSGAVLAYAVTPLTTLDQSCTLNNTCATQLNFTATFR